MKQVSCGSFDVGAGDVVLDAGVDDLEGTTQALTAGCVDCDDATHRSARLGGPRLASLGSVLIYSTTGDLRAGKSAGNSVAGSRNTDYFSNLLSSGV